MMYVELAIFVQIYTKDIFLCSIFILLNTFIHYFFPFLIYLQSIEHVVGAFYEQTRQIRVFVKSYNVAGSHEQ